MRPQQLLPDHPMLAALRLQQLLLDQPILVRLLREMVGTIW